SNPGGGSEGAAEAPFDERVTYAEAVARLLALRGGEHAGMRPGLERIEGLLAALGHPERRYRLVQVGGTNGKGSVAAMLAAILKSGLGGRLAATTVGAPAVTVVTRIDLDHQAVLGTTLREIAAEKAAIIRAGVAVAASQAPEATAVLVRRATEVGVPLLLSGRDLSVTVEHRGLDGQLVGRAGPGWLIARLPPATPW